MLCVFLPALRLDWPAGLHAAGIAGIPACLNLMTHYFILHAGGLGDLALASALVAGLRRPDRRILLATRENSGRIVELFPGPPDEWVALPSDPLACCDWAKQWSAPG